MLVLDKERVLDRMVWLSQRQPNAVPEFLRPQGLRWTTTADGRRSLDGEVVLRPTVLERVRRAVEPRPVSIASERREPALMLAIPDASG